MIKNKQLIIDLDNTIINTPKSIINLHNKLNPNKQYNYTDNIDWKFKPLIKSDEELSELFKLFDHEDFYKDVIVFPNAIEIINELAENNRVIICSKHMESRKKLSREWINEVMPKVEIRFVDNFEDKGKLFDKVDYVIDDKWESFENFSEDTTCILFNEYQWNKDCVDYHRCMNWNEVENYIETREGFRTIIERVNKIQFVEDYYDKSPLKFAEDCLGTSIKLKWYQKFFIKHMSKISFRMGRR